MYLKYGGTMVMQVWAMMENREKECAVLKSIVHILGKRNDYAKAGE